MSMSGGPEPSLTMDERIRLSLDGVERASIEQVFFYAKTDFHGRVAQAIARELLAFRKAHEDAEAMTAPNHHPQGEER